MTKPQPAADTMSALTDDLQTVWAHWVDVLGVEDAWDLMTGVLNLWHEIERAAPGKTI